jgi:hypothetical protein
MDDTNNSQNELQQAQEKEDSPEEKKSRLSFPGFWIGVVAFLGLNGILYAIFTSFALYRIGLRPGTINILRVVIPLLANVALIILAAIGNRRILGGVLSAFGCLILIGIAAGIFLMVTCFQYF